MGPVPGFPPLVQPVVHALLQARDEVNAFMEGFPDEKLWERPAGVASVGFHLRHLTGVLDRLLTYARGEGLSGEQLNYLKGEGIPEEGKLLGREGMPEGGKPPKREGTPKGGKLPKREGMLEGDGLGKEGEPVGDGNGPMGGNVAKYLVERFNIQVDKALEQIKGIKEEELTARRDVGRDRIPSTVGGLIFHAAEHTQRHVGQLLVTVRVVNPSGDGRRSGS